MFQLKHFGIVALIVLAGFFIFKKRVTQGSASAKKLSVDEPDQNQSEITYQKEAGAFNPIAYSQEITANRKRIYTNRILGLKTLNLKKSQGKVSIPFEFVPRKVWCQGGDLDTIRYATSREDAKEVLISLETMGTNQVREGFHVSHEDLLKGLTHTFTVDEDHGKKSLSLAICSDRKKTGSCKKAQVINQTQLNAKLGAKSNQLEGDFLFYFQHLLFDGNSVQTYRSDVFTSQYKKSLNDYLSNAKVDSEESKEAWQRNKTIRSNPVDISNGKIRLSLPYNDPRCLPGN